MLAAHSGYHVGCVVQTCDAHVWGAASVQCRGWAEHMRCVRNAHGAKIVVTQRRFAPETRDATPTAGGALPTFVGVSKSAIGCLEQTF